MPAPPDRASEAYARYVLGLLVRRLRPQLPRPPDPLDPRRAHQGRSAADATPDRLPLRHRVRRLLRAVRHSARPPGRRLGAHPPDRARAGRLEPDDRASAFARNFAELSAARIGVGIGEASANPGRLLAALRLLPAGAPRHGARHLFERHLHRRRPRPRHRRADRRALGRGLRRRGAAARPARLAGRVSRRRPAGAVARPVGGDPARAAARRATGAESGRRRRGRSRRSSPSCGAVLPPFTLVTLALARRPAGRRCQPRRRRRRRAGGRRADRRRRVRRRSGSRSASASTPPCRGRRRCAGATRAAYAAIFSHADPALRRGRLRAARLHRLRGRLLGAAVLRARSAASARPRPGSSSAAPRRRPAGSA